MFNVTASSLGMSEESTRGKLAWEGWTIREKVKHLKGKLRLEEFAFRGYFEWAENEKQRNEDTIIRLRREMKSRLVSLERGLNADAEVINNVFQNRKTERLSFQRHTADETVVEMDQKVCEREKYLDALRYARVVAEDRLRNLKDSLDRMVLIRQGVEHVEPDTRIRILENALEKSRMKLDMGRSISHHYDFIVNKMKEESLCFPGRLEVMERGIAHERCQLLELKKMLDKALEARNEAKTQLAICEQECQAAKRQRDQVLTATRNEVEMRKGLWEEKPSKRLMKGGFALEPNASGEAEKLAIRNKRLYYKDIFENMRYATGLSSWEDFIHKLLKQDEVCARLTDTGALLRKTVEHFTKEREKLRYLMDEQMYSTRRKPISGLQAAMDDVFEKIQQQQERKEECKEKLELAGRFILNVKAGVVNLLDQLKNVKLKPITRNYSRGNVEEDLENCRAKLVMLYERVEASLEKSVGRLGVKTVSELLGKREFYEAFQRQLSDSNIRIKLAQSLGSVSSSDYDYEQTHHEETVFSRDDIKRIAQKIVDSHTKPKKRQSKKK